MKAIHLVAPAATLLAACTFNKVLVAPEVAAELRPPAGQQLYFETLAEGVQVYECVTNDRAPTGYAWAFRGPEATLMDRQRAILGKHYGGPTWEANDGSKVVAEVRGKTDAPDAKAIPWLLLGTKSREGKGTFDAVTSIQRLATEGGIAPSGGCDGGRVGQKARVPYKATYYFYRPRMAA